MTRCKWLWAQVATGKELDSEGTAVLLDASAWQERRRRLLGQGDTTAVLLEPMAWHRRESLATEGDGQWFAAAWYLQRLAEAEPSDWHHHARLGRAYTELRQLPKALKALERAIELRKDEWTTWFTLGVAHALLGESDKALADYAAALQLNDRNWGTWYEKGLVYARREQWPEAWADFDRATLNKPVPVKVWSDYALVCVQLEKKSSLASAREVLQAHCVRSGSSGEVAMAVWACCLAPPMAASPSANKLLVQAVQRAATGAPTEYPLARAVGAVLYRDGQYADAVRH